MTLAGTCGLQAKQQLACNCAKFSEEGLIKTHPKAEHFSSLAWCFLLSVASRTAPNVAPASAKVEGISGERTEMSRGTGLPRFQFCNRISSG